MDVVLKKIIFIVLSITLIVNITFFSLPVLSQASLHQSFLQASLDEDDDDNEDDEDDDDDRECSLGCIGGSLEQVFPFDIFSGIPASGGDFDCPKFTIFSQDFQFCLLVDAVQVLKFPVIISLLIKIYLFS